MYQGFIFYLGIIHMYFVQMVTIADALCTFPADLRGSWISAEQGVFRFTENELSGYKISLTKTFNSSDFECNTLSNDQYYIRGTSAFDLFGISLRPHICLQFKKITTEKYNYYVATAIEATTNNRIYIKNDNEHVTHDDVCNRQTPFELGTYVMLIRIGASEASLAVECPRDISQNFENVKFRSFDGIYSCSGKLEILTDKLKMNYTYTTCDNRITFSVGGLWSCLYHTYSDSTTYLAALNTDASIVNGQTYTIVCYTLQWQGETLKATIYPGSCLPNQTASYVSSPGVLVEMFDMSNHELGLVTYEGGHTIFTGVAVGISVAVIVLVCILAVTVFIRQRYINKTTVDNALDQHDIAHSQYPIDDTILYSQVSKSIRQHNASEDNQSPYSLSEKGVYDHTNERRHVVTNTDVYSHAVDTVYDSSEQHTRQDQREEIYDHVFGQKMED